MSALFLYGILLVILMLACIDIFYPSGTKKIILVIIELVLIAITRRYNLLFRQENLLLIVVSGLLGGQLVFIISMFLVNRPRRELWELVKPLGKWIRYYLNLDIMVRYLIISAYEELLWRGSIQYLLGNSIIAIFATSAFFLLRHLGSAHEFYPSELLELFLFSCFLGLVFFYTRSMCLITIIHATRDINLSYLRNSHGEQTISIENYDYL